MPPQQTDILLDVVALVRQGDPLQTAKRALQTRLESNGAKVVTRLGKDVTHILYERRHSQRPKDKAADEAELLELYKKLDKYACPPFVISPLWLEASLAAGRRVVEKRYLVGRPKESLLAPALAPGSGGGSKKRRRASALPKPADAYELDLHNFSSTQHLNNGSRAEGQQGGEEVASPGRGGPVGRRGAKRGKAAGHRGSAQVQQRARLPAVQEAAGEKEGEQKQQRPQQQQQQHCRVGACAGGRLPAIGLATQQVADILAVDLAMEELPGAGGPQGDEDDLDTPLSVRCARNSLGGRQQTASGGRGQPSEVGLAAHAEAGARVAPAGRSRLARMSPHEGPVAGAADEGSGCPGGSGVEAMEVEDHLPASPQGQQASPQQLEQQQEEEGDGGGRERRQQREAELRRQKGVAARFSTRQLERNLAKPLLLHKATPLPGAEPPPSAEAARKGPILVPLVERVPSPWAAAAAIPHTSHTTRQPRKSLLGPGGNASTPLDPAGLPHRADGKLPTPWSTLRPWDKQAAAVAGPAAVPAAPGSGIENVPQQQEEGEDEQVEQQHQAAEQSPESDAAAPPAAGRGLPAVPRGCLAVTSCESGIADLAKAATARLRGMRMCPEGREDGQLTHLVIGSERRTLKTMLAVAAGAWLLSPAWLTASLEAGRWQPEAQFVAADLRFSAAVERARLAGPDQPGLLAAESVYVHLPDKATKLMGSNASALRRVAAALGAKPGTPKGCTICAVVGGGKRPAALRSAAVCVREEWLLQAAETYERPPLQAFLVK